MKTASLFFEFGVNRPIVAVC